MKIEDSVAVITGGASGIGLAVAEALILRGGKVVIADVNDKAGQAAVARLEKLAISSEDSVLFVKCDVTDPKQVENVFQSAINWFEGVDIFCNNAGIGEGWNNFISTPEELQANPASPDWETVMQIDFVAAVRATHIAVQKFRQLDRPGLIIHTSSMGSMIPMDTTPVYGACKAGLLHFTTSLNLTLRNLPNRIRVTAVCPSFADTALVRQMGDEAVEGLRAAMGGRILEAGEVAEGFIRLIEEETPPVEKNGQELCILRVTVQKGCEYVFPNPIGRPPPKPASELSEAAKQIKEAADEEARKKKEKKIKKRVKKEQEKQASIAAKL